MTSRGVWAVCSGSGPSSSSCRRPQPRWRPRRGAPSSASRSATTACHERRQGFKPLRFADDDAAAFQQFTGTLARRAFLLAILGPGYAGTLPRERRPCPRPHARRAAPDGRRGPWRDRGGARARRRAHRAAALQWARRARRRWWRRPHAERRVAHARHPLQRGAGVTARAVRAPLRRRLQRRSGRAAARRRRQGGHADGGGGQQRLRAGHVGAVSTCWGGRRQYGGRAGARVGHLSGRHLSRTRSSRRCGAPPTSTAIGASNTASSPPSWRPNRGVRDPRARPSTIGPPPALDGQRSSWTSRICAGQPTSRGGLARWAGCSSRTRAIAWSI